MGRSASKEESTADDVRREELRTALVHLQADRDRLRRIAAELEMRRALARLSVEQQSSSTSSSPQISSQRVCIFDAFQHVCNFRCRRFEQTLKSRFNMWAKWALLQGPRCWRSAKLIYMLNDLS